MPHPMKIRIKSSLAGVVLASFAFSLGALGADVKMLGVVKQLAYQQNGASAVPAGGAFAGFNAWADTAASAVTNATIKLPGGSSMALVADGSDSWNLDRSYVSQTLLDAAFPNGTYALTLNTVHDGTKVLNVALTGNAFPPPPQVSNYADAQSVDSHSSFTFSWGAFTGGTAGDYIQFRLENASGQKVFGTGEPGQVNSLNGTSTSVAIPAGTLQPNTQYNCRLLFAKLVTYDMTAYPGAMIIGAYAIETQLSVRTASATGPDVDFYGVAKGVNYTQSSDAGPVLESNPYVFMSWVDTSQDGVSAAIVTSPTGSGNVLQHEDGGSWNFDAGYPTQASLDAAHPDGTYTMVLVGVHDGVRTANLPLTGTHRPNAPRILNYSALQSADPASMITISWAPFASGTASDYVQVQVEDNTRNTIAESERYRTPNALTGLSTSFSIPAGRLTSGTQYSVRIMFAAFAGSDTTSYGQGVVGVSAFLTTTTFTLVTSGAPVDTTPPTLLLVTPMNGANGVLRTSPILFQFSEPMRGSFSITWGVETPMDLNWSSDGRVLVCTHSAPFPGGRQLNWTLNPSDFSPGFRDLVGNPLASNISGSFATAPAVSAVLSIHQVAASQWKLHVVGDQVPYVLESTTSLVPPVSWSSMVNFVGSSGGFDFTDGVAGPRRFYRVREGF